MEITSGTGGGGGGGGAVTADLTKVAGTATSVNSGVTDAGTQRVILASDGPTVSVLGTTADAAAADATGSINAHLRQVAKAQADGTQVAKPKTLSLSGSASASSASGNLIAETDAGDYRWVSVVLAGTFNATSSFEQSNDNASWYPLPLARTDAISVFPSSTLGTAGQPVAGPLTMRYFRARVSSYVSGTVTATAWLSAAPAQTQTVVTDSYADGRVPGPLSVSINFPLAYNGISSDRYRNNHELTVLASAARTASVNSGDQTNYNGARVKVVIDITAVAGSPSLTFTIKGKSTLSGKYFTLLASAALTGVGTTVLTVSPGATAAANLTANDFVPRLWRVEVVAGTADSVTYSVDAQVVV